MSSDASEGLADDERSWLDDWRDRCEADPALMRHNGYGELFDDILRHRVAAAEAKGRADAGEDVARAILRRRVPRRADNTQRQIGAREALELAARIARDVTR